MKTEYQQYAVTVVVCSEYTVNVYAEDMSTAVAMVVDEDVCRTEEYQDHAELIDQGETLEDDNYTDVVESIEFETAWISTNNDYIHAKETGAEPIIVNDGEEDGDE